MKRSWDKVQEGAHETKELVNAPIVPSSKLLDCAWLLLSDFGVDIHVKLACLSRVFYRANGGVVKLFNLIVKLKRHDLLTRGAREVYAIENLLHPLHWQLLGGASEHYDPRQFVEAELKQNGLDKLIEQLEHAREVIGGGAARSVVMKALRRAQVRVHPSLNDGHTDIDIFLNGSESESSYFERRWKNQQDERERERVNVAFSHSFNAPNCLSQNYNVQFISFGPSGPWRHESCLPGDVIMFFDFTSCQVSICKTARLLMVKLTPAFLFAILTGKMYMTFFEATSNGGWPFVDLMPSILTPYLPAQLPLQGTLQAEVFWAHKICYFRRLLKNEARGFRDVIVTMEQKLHMRAAMTECRACQPDAHCPYFNNYTGGSENWFCPRRIPPLGEDVQEYANHMQFISALFDSAPCSLTAKNRI